MPLIIIFYYFFSLLVKYAILAQQIKFSYIIYMLKSAYYTDKVEAGCDEAGRGCLAGSVYAAAVILPPNYENELLKRF